MADYTSIQIIKKAPNVWVFSDNKLPSGKYWFSNAYQDIGNEDLVSFTTRNGSNIYNSQPYSIYSYTDELDSGNDFTPTSADDLHIKLTERGFFDNTGGGGGSTPTLQGLANSLFGSLFGRGGQVVLIDDSELGFTTAAIDGLFQNNVARTTTYYFTGSGEVTANDMTTKVNNLIQVGNPDPAGFTISEIQSPVIMIGVRAGVSYVYVFKKGKGTWGTLANPVEASDFRLISFYNTTPEDIEDDPNATIIPLEDVVGNDFLAVANLTEWDFSDSGDATEDGGIITYYFTYTGEDSVEYFVRFIGDAGIYGGEETPFTSDMFTLTTSSVTSPDPTLLQVLTSGNTANLPIYLTTDDKTTKFSGEGLEYSEEENENTVTIRFESPIGTVDLTVPAKSANDTFAMLSDLATGLAGKISQGGDSFGEPVIVGSNDDESLFLKGGGLIVVVNTNGLSIPDGKRIGNSSDSDVWRIYVGTATTEATWRRNTPDNFAAMVTENANDASTGDIQKFDSNIGGTTATRAAVRKDGRIWATDATEAEDLATLGQIQAALDDKVEIGGDLGGTALAPIVERLSQIAQEGKTVVAVVFPDGEVSYEEIMDEWVYDDTTTPYTLATLVAAYPTSAGRLRGFEVRCRNLTPPTDYRKDSDGDDKWTKVERTVMT